MNAIAKQLLQDDKLDEAIAKLGETVAVANEYGDEETAEKAQNLIPQVYMKKAGGQLNAKEFEAAAETYAKVLELQPANGVAALRYGMALENANKDAEAIEAYKLAAANGQEKNANSQLGKFYLKRSVENLKAKKYADAVNDANASFELMSNPQALQVAGQASQLGGKNTDAIKYFEQYLEAAPNAKNAGQIAYTVGALYQQAKNNAKAKEFFSKAVSDPKYGADAQKALKAL
jgi:tetratricopeptide (TPR) repeat protein